MSMPKISEILLLSTEDLEKEILDLKKQLFDLRLRKATRQSFKPHFFRHLKHRINQLLMVKENKLSTRKKKDL